MLRMYTYAKFTHLYSIYTHVYTYAIHAIHHIYPIYRYPDRPDRPEDTQSVGCRPSHPIGVENWKIGRQS